MIYRKWSLLTGPAVLLGGAAVALLAVDSIFRKQNQFDKSPANKQELIHAAK